MSQSEGLRVDDLLDQRRLIAMADDETECVCKREMEEVCSLEKRIDSFEEDREQLQVVCEGVDEVEAEQGNFKQLLNELCVANEQLKQISASEEEVPLHYEESRQRSLFEKCMGLEFRVTEDQAMCLVYNLLDSNDLERKFSITVDVDHNSQWTVVGMEPHVHGVRTELNELNKSGNFGQFCKAIRQKFKEYAAAKTEEI